MKYNKNKANTEVEGNIINIENMLKPFYNLKDNIRVETLYVVKESLSYPNRTDYICNFNIYSKNWAEIDIPIVVKVYLVDDLCYVYSKYIKTLYTEENMTHGQHYQFKDIYLLNNYNLEFIKTEKTINYEY